jgi:hypothetical protein
MVLTTDHNPRVGGSSPSYGIIAASVLGSLPEIVAVPSEP